MSTAAVRKHVKLDKIDRKILSDLQSNGRMTNVELANRSGISAPPCLRRVRSLEDNNIIQGYYAHLNTSKLGYGVTSFVTVRLKEQNDENMMKFEQELAKHDCIREAYSISGDYDFLLRIVAKDWDDYQDFLSNVLTRIEDVSSVRSSLRIKTAKFTPGVPVEVE